MSLTYQELIDTIESNPSGVREALELVKRQLAAYPSATSADDGDTLALSKDDGSGTTQALSVAILLANVLKDSDLAANGGTVPEVDRNPTITGFYKFGRSGTSQFALDNPNATANSTFNVGHGNAGEFFLSNDGFTRLLEIGQGGGVVIENPTGLNKGSGTLNAEELYDNGNRVATSDYVFDADQDGEIDTAHYDAAIGTKEVESDTETEEVEEEFEVTETVEESMDEWCSEKGCYERRIVQRERTVHDEYPVLCPDTGNRLGTKRVARKEKRKVQRPKKVEVQLQHKPARRFEHDDLDPATFAAKCHARRKLPAMDRCEQNLREGQERPSMGEWTQALMETCEVYAVHVSRLRDEIDSLKARIEALESK